MTSQLLRYARPIRLEKKPLSASSFLAELDLSDAVSEGREIIRRADDVIFMADRAQLGAALIELIRNADTAMSGLSGPIRIGLVASGDSIEFSVVDSGRGMPDSLDAPPTEPFVTGDPVNRFGLGLSVASQIAELHDGRLNVVPGDPSGTVVRLTLPRSPHQAP